jgi:small subunit ribosomal protein S17
MSNKIMSGIVVSSHEKTISVEVERLVMHKMYQKTLKKHEKILSHDEDMAAKVGDLVEIVETKPISRRKSWKLSKIIK